MVNKIKLGMVGGGTGAFIGAVHRIAARIDDKYEFVAGCLSSTPEKSKMSAKDINLDLNRSYLNFKSMASYISYSTGNTTPFWICSPFRLFVISRIFFLRP